MPGLLLQHKPKLWPATPAQIDPVWAWAWQGLIYAMPLWEGAGLPIEIIRRGRSSSSFANWSWTHTTLGQSLTANGSQSALIMPGAAFPLGSGSVPWTISIVVDNLNISGTDFSTLLSTRSGGTGWTARAEQTSNTGFIGFTKFGTADTSSDIATPTGPSLICWTLGADHAVTTTVINLIPGGLITQSDGDTQSWTDSTVPLAIGATSTGEPFTGSILAIYAWDRAIPEDDIRRLGRSPFGMFHLPEKVRIGLPPGGVTVQRTFLGAISSGNLTGALAKKPEVTFEGVDTPTGLITKKPLVTFEGSDTPTGALTTIKKILLSVAGAIATITGALVKKPLIARGGAATPAGALARKPLIVVIGSDTPTGSLSKQAQVTFEGSDTPTGALSVIQKILASMAGTISVITGALSFKVLKALAGSDTPTGSLDQKAAVTFEGADTPTGSLDKKPSVTFEGTVTSVGVLSTIRKALLTVAGTITSAGTLARKVLLSRGGTVASSGTVTKIPKATFEGTVTSVGGLAKKVLKALAGALATAGSLATLAIVSGAAKVVRTYKGAAETDFSRKDPDNFSGGTEDSFKRKAF